MPVARVAAINLECADPTSLARFWAELLDGQIAAQTPAFCAVKAGALFLGATHVEGYQPPTWPSAERSQQLHLDLAVDDLDTAEREALRLGRRHQRDSPTLPEPLTRAARPSRPPLLPTRLIPAEAAPSPQPTDGSNVDASARGADFWWQNCGVLVATSADHSWPKLRTSSWPRTSVGGSAEPQGIRLPSGPTQRSPKTVEDHVAM